MAVLDKYKLTTKPPKIRSLRAKVAPMERIRKKFLAGVEKQKSQAKAWKPGVKDLRSWVARDEACGLAWVTVKYGPLPVTVNGKAQSTIGPVKLSAVPEVFDDIKKAAQAGELDPGLKKVAIQGPRKKKRTRSATGKRNSP